MGQEASGDSSCANWSLIPRGNFAGQEDFCSLRASAPRTTVRGPPAFPTTFCNVRRYRANPGVRSIGQIFAMRSRSTLLKNSGKLSLASRVGLTPSPTCHPGQGGFPQGDAATSATNQVARLSALLGKPTEGFLLEWRTTRARGI
jgi:hypothetical protein